MNNTTQTQAPPAAPPPAAPSYALAPPRGPKKSGRPTDGMWILGGLPKSGKTSLAASIPDCAVLELEQGGGDRVGGWFQEVADLRAFRLALKAAVAEPGVRAVAIDTIDVLIDWLGLEACRTLGIADLGEKGAEGKNGWQELREKVDGMTGYLKSCGKLVVLLSHYREPKLDKDNKLCIPATIDAPGRIGTFLCAQADAIGHCFKRQAGPKTQFVVSFRGGPLGTWGNRIRELEDRELVLPERDQWSAVDAVFRAPGEPVPAAEATPGTNGKTPAKAAAAAARRAK